MIEIAFADNLQAIKLLIENGAYINVTNEVGNTVLQFAIRENNIEIAKLLINADAEIEDFTGHTALTYASEFNKIDIGKLLIENGTDVNYKSVDGRTALISATDNGHTAIINILKKAGAKK